MKAGRLPRRGFIAGAAAGPLLMTAAQARAQGIAPKRGGTLTSLLTPEPPILVLGVNSQGPTLLVGGKIYQGLLSFSADMQPQPVLATSWDISPDKRTYTFHLRDGVTFHDGTPMTAADVLFSVMNFAMTLSTRARTVFSQIETASAPDKLTAVFTLKAPYEPFLLAFPTAGCPIVPRHIYEGTDYRNNPANAVPIGTGPFRFKEWQRGSYIRLVRNESYWRPGLPYLDEIIYRIVPDGQSRATALQTGQVQLAAANDIEPFDLPRFQQQPGLSVTTRGWEYYSPLSWFEVNQRVKPLDDVRVRQAMSRAIDRDFIVKRLWFGVGRPATGPLASTVRYYDPAAAIPPYDPAAANRLLDEAGLKPDGSGVRFTIRHMPLPYGEVWTRLSEYFRTAMGRIGIKVVMDSVDAGGWAARMAAWDYDTSVNFVYQVGDPSYSVEGYYLSDNIRHVTFTNTSGFSNKEVDALFLAARNEPDPARRGALFSKAQHLIVEQMPYLYLVQMSYPTYHASALQNLITDAHGPHAGFDEVFFA